jgi:hypothetical protein
VFVSRAFSDCYEPDRYCKREFDGKWKETLMTLQHQTTKDFLFYVCEESKGQIKSWGTTKVYIRQFQQFYTSVTGRFMDRNEVREVYKVCVLIRAVVWRCSLDDGLG